jgi:prohibitin 2
MDDTGKIIVKIAVWVIAGLVALFLFLGSFFTVQPGERAFTVTFGQIGDEVYENGFHFKKPFVSSVVKMDVQTQKIEVDASAASKDLQTVATKVAVNWSIQPSAVRDVYKNIGDEDALAQRLLQPAIQESIKWATAQFSAEELITKRSQVSDLITKNLQDNLLKNGINITGINILNFDFSDSFDKAIEAKVQAEQEALTAKNQLSRIEYEGKQKASTAEYEKQASISKAQGEAESIRIQTEAIEKAGWAAYIELKRIEKWDGVLPTMITNGTPLLNIK